jgi:pimeloyl-ACP methyl ester carboxylesterase
MPIMKKLSARMVSGLVLFCAIFLFLETPMAGNHDSRVQAPTGGVADSIRLAFKDQRPSFEFGEKASPPAPDYADPDTWAALPGRQDGAEAFPPNSKYPEAQATAQADVFFVHPTGYDSPEHWNAPWDDEAAAEQTLGMMIYCASAFNASSKVYAPRYRQFPVYAVMEPGPSGIKAVELAYFDVARAFEYFIKHRSQGRPFILAGHSQGSLHAMRLLQEKIIGTPLAKRLVAAYLVGYAVPHALGGIKPSKEPTETGVLIAYNSFTPQGDPSFFTQGACIWLEGKYQKVKGRPLVQVNPLSWRDGGGPVPASDNPGSLPVTAETYPLGELAPGVTGADASGEVLRITAPAVPGFPGAGSGVPFLDSDFGDYHNYDYQLFYESIRRNALERVRAFVAGQKS